MACFWSFWALFKASRVLWESWLLTAFWKSSIAKTFLYYACLKGHMQRNLAHIARSSNRLHLFRAIYRHRFRWDVLAPLYIAAAPQQYDQAKFWLFLEMFLIYRSLALLLHLQVYLKISSWRLSTSGSNLSISSAFEMHSIHFCASTAFWSPSLSFTSFLILL